MNELWEAVVYDEDWDFTILLITSDKQEAIKSLKDAYEKELTNGGEAVTDYHITEDGTYAAVEYQGYALVRFEVFCVQPEHYHFSKRWLSMELCRETARKEM